MKPEHTYVCCNGVTPLFVGYKHECEAYKANAPPQTMSILTLEEWGDLNYEHGVDDTW